jgi:hypothetical protein
LNPENARKLAEEMAKGFQSIKRISREYEHITRPLERHLPALPITKLPPPPTTPSSSEESSNNSGDQEMLRQSNAWKRYILWEKRNPLNLQNHQEVMKRGRHFTKIILSILNMFLISGIFKYCSLMNSRFYVSHTTSIYGMKRRVIYANKRKRCLKNPLVTVANS